MAETLKGEPLKDEVIEMIRRLPGDCGLDDILYHLHVRHLVEQGLTEIDQGKVVPHEEAKQKCRVRWARPGSYS